MNTCFWVVLVLAASVPSSATAGITAISSVVQVDADAHVGPAPSGGTPRPLHVTGQSTQVGHSAFAGIAQTDGVWTGPGTAWLIGNGWLSSTALTLTGWVAAYSEVVAAEEALSPGVCNFQGCTAVTAGSSQLTSSFTIDTTYHYRFSSDAYSGFAFTSPGSNAFVSKNGIPNTPSGTLGPGTYGVTASTASLGLVHSPGYTNPGVPALASAVGRASFVLQLCPVIAGVGPCGSSQSNAIIALMVSNLTAQAFQMPSAQFPYSVPSGKFLNVSSGNWVDPASAETSYDFSMTSNSLFTRIASLPVGLDADNRMTVSYGDLVLGTFAGGDSVDFTGQFGGGVPVFQVSGIDRSGSSFPIKLEFNTASADFFATPAPEPETVIMLAWGVIGLAGLSRNSARPRPSAMDCARSTPRRSSHASDA